MPYSTTDLAELIRHHLVFSDADEESIASSLRQLIAAIRQMAPVPLDTEIEWFFCDQCGCAVDTDVLATDAANFTPDGGFYCSDCISGNIGDD